MSAFPPLPPNVHAASHPLIAHKITRLRNRDTKPAEFRSLLREISFYLGYEATSSVTSREQVVTTPMNEQFVGSEICDNIAIIPILRAGLIMGDGVLDLIPTAVVHHIGMFRSKVSNLPVQYYNRLPRDQPCDTAFVVDPCVATSNTLHAVVSICKKWGAKKVVVLAAVGAREGLTRLANDHPDVDIYIGSCDDELNEMGMLIPGLGDSGDRQFGTPITEAPAVLQMSADEEMLKPESPKKRTRSSEKKN
jgi:uracil phosphoribosyltransferase